MKTTFIFLHGSWHAAWNWHKVLPLLEQAGHRGVALDLPGHGHDRTPARAVTLSTCVDRVVEEIDRCDGPIVLVAHSRNGIVISQAAERRPEKVTGLTYLAAYLVPNGRSMMEYALLDPESLAVQNTTTAIPRRWLPTLVRWLRSGVVRWLSAWLLPRSLQVHRLAPASYREALYHDCPNEIVELANVLLEPEPNWAGFTPLELTRERYGRVPRIYIECAQDRAVTPTLQRRMIDDSPCVSVLRLDSGHSPFFSQPDKLVDALCDGLATMVASSSAGSGADVLRARAPRASP
jgi:pimeloyl-ACP methyl ester carboxylesterase